MQHFNNQFVIDSRSKTTQMQMGILLFAHFLQDTSV